jgi:VanZ family protein
MSRFFNNCFRQLLPMLSVRLDAPLQEGSIRRMLTAPTGTPRARRKPLLTIVWIVTTGLFAALLLHPAVPAAIRSIVARPNRALAKAVEYGAHVAVFFIGTQFALVCLDGTGRRRLFAILASAAVVAVAAELAQMWVPTRGVEVFDALCNLAGVTLAAVAYRKMFRLIAAGPAV